MPIGGDSRLVGPSIALSTSSGDRKALDLILIAIKKENICCIVGIITYQVTGCRDKYYLAPISRGNWIA